MKDFTFKVVNTSVFLIAAHYLLYQRLWEKQIRLIRENKENIDKIVKDENFLKIITKIF